MGLALRDVPHHKGGIGEALACLQDAGRQPGAGERRAA
jgi:hypothetical protein